MVSWLIVIVWCIQGALSAICARSRGRSPLAWFFLGLLFGWLGLIVLFILPPKLVEVSEVPKEPKNDKAIAEVEIPKALMGWFYVDGGRVVQGPCTIEELKKLWQSGRLTAESWVWNMAITEWKKISQEGTLSRWLSGTDCRT